VLYLSIIISAQFNITAFTQTRNCSLVPLLRAH